MLNPFKENKRDKAVAHARGSEGRSISRDKGRLRPKSELELIYTNRVRLKRAQGRWQRS
jgi:hypothetical protein